MWITWVQAAFTILSSLSNESVTLLHGGAQHTAESVNNALMIAKAFFGGTADQLQTTDIHPAIQAQAETITAAAA